VRITKRRRWIVMAGAALAAACAALAVGESGARTAGHRPTADASAGSRPNFLFVLVDDQATNSFHRRFMPQTFKWIVDRGTRFTDALAAPPLCCPDRAGLITGQYPHNNQVWSNHPGYAELADRANTLAPWLERAGYRTGFFGKFLNHYGLIGGINPAPGFDRWFAFTQESTTYYDYNVSDDGHRRSYGHARADYSTDVLTDEAGAFMRDSLDGSRPFFAWLAYSAPHLNPMPSGPCAGNNPVPPDAATLRRFASVPLPHPPSFNEAGISDKPRKIRNLPKLDSQKVAELTLRWHCTLAAMSEVDSELGHLMNRLHAEGALRNTIVIYLSDNGFFFGEHRIPNGKGLVYEPALRVPFAVSVPHAYRTGPLDPRSDAVVANQDIAPTILRYIDRYAGSAAPCNPPTDCRRLDGRSLLPLLHGGGHWRPGGRGVLVEIDSRHTPAAARAAKRRRVDPECNCAYEAIRTHRYLYSELSTGERELYDLARDPDELVNRAHTRRYAKTRRELAARLAVLERCSGQRGREPATAAPFCE
jgi:N-acetylglucosamine-6-sulfatase